MKRIAGAMLALMFLLPVGMSVIAAAQDKPMGHMPPKVLVVMREYTKPGKAGMQHEKTESLFVPVSYTHLDVYKRQAYSSWACPGQRRSRISR